MSICYNKNHREPDLREWIVMTITFETENGAIEVRYEDDAECQRITKLIEDLKLRFTATIEREYRIISADVHFSFKQRATLVSDDDEPLLTRPVTYPTEKEIIDRLIQIGGQQIARAEDDLDPIVDDILDIRPKGP